MEVIKFLFNDAFCGLFQSWREIISILRKINKQETKKLFADLLLGDDRKIVLFVFSSLYLKVLEPLKDSFVWLNAKSSYNCSQSHQSRYNDSAIWQKLLNFSERSVTVERTD